MDTAFSRRARTLMFLSLLVLSATTTSALFSTAATAGQPPVQSDADLGFFHDSRTNVLAHMKRVGLLPVFLPAGFAEREDIKTSLEAKITEALKQAGMDVVGSGDYKAALTRFSQQLGGIYDPMTGAMKPEQSKAADANARREIIEKNHLDGYVIVSIRATKANFYSSIARWDGALERSDGRVAPPGFVETLVKGPGLSNGTLPAYSLAIQISNTEHQIVFGHYGGIQLVSYYDPNRRKGDNDFMSVPRDSLLRDAKRLERAVHIATLPLLHSAEEIAAGRKDPSINFELLTDLPPPPAGSLPERESPFKVPRDQILAGTHRVVVSTVGHAGFNIDADTKQRYMKLIRTELAPLGWEVIESDKALIALGEALRNSHGIYDPVSGALNTAGVAEIRKAVFSNLGISPAPDAILWVQMVGTVAQHHWGDVEWDGVSQSGVTLGPVHHAPHAFGGTNNPYSGDGALRAVSLLVQLRDTEDALLYENRGGVQLLQQLNGKTPVDLAATELFHDTTREQPAVHAALRDLTLTREQLDLELHPHATTAR